MGYLLYRAERRAGGAGEKRPAAVRRGAHKPSRRKLRERGARPARM